MTESQSFDLDSLLSEYKDSYLNTPKGIAHLGAYKQGRLQATKNWQEIQDAVAGGEDVTDLVLDRLLPHKDTPHNRDRGAWVHIAPTVTKDVRKWFVNKGWALEKDWPDIAKNVLRFVETAIAEPVELKSACNAFGASPYSKGIQAGFLSPILNALRPDDYRIFNAKSRKTLRLITGEKLTRKIEVYPRANEALENLLEREGSKFAETAVDGARLCDVFDAFCHWLVAVKKMEKSQASEKVPREKAKRVDRYDPESAAQVFSFLFADESVRRTCLEDLADAIELANTHGNLRWGVSLFSRHITLNIAKLVGFHLRREIVVIGLAPQSLDDAVREELRQRCEDYGSLSTTTPTELYTLSVEVYLELKPKLESAFRDFARIAAGTARKTPSANAHSPGAIKQLEIELGRALPQPGYSSERGAPSVMPAAIAIRTPRTVFKRVEYDVAGLLTYIENGDIGLPDIQRPFVWSATKVRDLFDSMYQGFPVGYLLFWENAEIQGTRPIGVAEKARKVASLLIVDGQQRLTSLYAVMRGQPVVDSNFRPVQLEIAFRPRDGRFDVSDAAIKLDPEFIPNISTLWTSDRASFRIISEFFKELESKRSITEGDRDAISHNLDRLFDLPKYPFTALEITPQVDEEAVSDIFVRINSEGVKLRQADFILTLLSVFWDEGRAELEDFSRRAKNPPTAGEPSPFNHLIEPTPNQLLRATIAVGFHRGRLKSVYQVLRGKETETGQFSPEMRDKQFDKLKAAQAGTLDLNHWHLFLASIAATGYRDASMISSNAALMYSYALYLIGKLQCGVDERSLKRLIGRWFFVVSLTGRYTGSAESALEADLVRVRDLTTPEAFTDALAKIISSTLTSDFWDITLPTALETSSTRTPAWHAYIAAQNRRGARVLFSDQRLWDAMDPSLGGTRKSVEAHHLFPKAWLAKNGVTERKQINQVANLAHLEWPDNASIGATGPAEYVPTLREHFSDVTWEGMYREHALPLGWESMKYVDFLEERRKGMAQVIRLGFEALSEENDETTDIASGTKAERGTWTAIESLERNLRTVVRAKYQEKWDQASDSRMRKILGNQAWQTIERSREKYLKQYRTSSPDQDLDILDFCYLGQLVQLMAANDAWELFRSPFRDKRELEDLIRAIVPVRNDQAHFRAVPEKELSRCQIAVDDVRGLLSQL